MFSLIVRYGNSNQPIWSSNMTSTPSDSCFGSKNSCPAIPDTSCTHYDDVSIICG